MEISNLYTYGSHLYGTNNSESDIDYMVVVENSSIQLALDHFFNGKPLEFKNGLTFEFTSKVFDTRHYFLLFEN